MQDRHRSRKLWAITAAVGILLATLPTAVAGDPAVEGQWDGPYCLPIVSIHTMHLRTGKLLMWNGFTNSPHLLDVANIDCVKQHSSSSLGFCDVAENRKVAEDYAPGCLTRVYNQKRHNNEPNDEGEGHRTNLFCAGHSHMADGSVLATGGHISVFGNHLGRRDVNIFLPDNADPDDMWETPPQDMIYRRWYPTNTTLPDGRVLITTGSNRYCFEGNNAGAECIRHIDCGNHGVCSGNICDGGGEDAEACNNDDDCLTDNEAGTCTKVRMASVPEIYDPANQSLTALPNANLSIPFYPFNFVLPDGRVFYAGAEARIGSGVDISGRLTYTLDVDSNQNWQFVHKSATRGGAALMYAPGKILKSGGAATDAASDLASIVTEHIDMTSGAPQWAPLDDMTFPRTRHNLTILPNGKILATGGTTVATGANNDADGILTAEMYELPPENKWTNVATMAQPRMYHSGALLLPDGRVVSVGGGHGGEAETNFRSVEFYSPPYMFNGHTKPTITEAPESLRYGDVFEVDIADVAAADVEWVTLHRLASVTHAFDQDHRFMRLDIVNKPNSSRLEVLAPLNARIAPPGYYMLFVVSKHEVPSIAKYVRIDPPLNKNLTGKSTVIWVDFDHGGTESGTFYEPWNTAAEGIGDVLPFGVMRIKNGVGAETPTITKPMKIESYGGSAVVGSP